MLRPKDTTVRKKYRKEMVEQLREGKEYGRGLDFFHPEKRKLLEGRRG